MLYDVFIDFWGFFFNSTTNPIPSQWVELLAVGSGRKRAQLPHQQRRTLSGRPNLCKCLSDRLHTRARLGRPFPFLPFPHQTIQGCKVRETSECRCAAHRYSVFCKLLHPRPQQDLPGSDCWHAAA